MAQIAIAGPERIDERRGLVPGWVQLYRVSAAG
jgi:hypothetical protein